MFTGIITDVGVVQDIRPTPYGARIIIAPTKDLMVKPSDSVAVNGVCLTLTDLQGGLLCFDTVRETLDRSTLAGLKAGEEVNLEPALRVGDPMGGHFVQGHVDAIGRVVKIVQDISDRTLRIEAPAQAVRYIVEKGSIAINGVSLTVAGVERNQFWVKIVPYTWDQTSLVSLKQGDAVNLETDILAKYIEKLIKGADSGGLTEDTLRRAGF